MTKPPFRYDAERSQEYFRQRFLGENATAFDGLLFQVLLHHDVAPLCRYLRSRKPLLKHERGGLAWLFEKLKPGPGRPRGRSRTDYLDAVRRVERVVRARREEELSAAGRQRLPPGRLEELVAEAIKQDAARRSSGFKLTGEDVDDIVARLRKGRG